MKVSLKQWKTKAAWKISQSFVAYFWAGFVASASSASRASASASSSSSSSSGASHIHIRRMKLLDQLIDYWKCEEVGLI